MQQGCVCPTTVLVIPSKQLFRFTVSEIHVGGLSAAATTVIPVVDDRHVVEDESEPVIGCGAQVIGLVVGWE